MKTKISIILVAFFVTAVLSAQQISDGFATNISDITQPIKSGVYQINSFAINPDESHSWQHLFVIRHSNESNNHQLQLSSSYNENDRIFFRKIANSSNPVWNELATRGSNNFTGDQNISGNLGIGVTNPTAKLEVSKSLITDNNEVVASLTRFGTGTGGSSIVRFGYHNTCDFEVNSGYSNAGHRFGNYFDLNIVNNFTGGAHGGINFVTNQSTKMVINVNGNVGVGTSNPTSKLTVAGNIASREVKVTVDAGADFVFEKDYNLPSLESVDQFIKKNKHLPEIASAQQMKQDGINLSEMNIKLLQKIEEMTLYMIEQNKRMDKMEKENNELKNNQLQFKKNNFRVN